MERSSCCSCSCEPCAAAAAARPSTVVWWPGEHGSEEERLPRPVCMLLRQPNGELDDRHGQPCSASIFSKISVHAICNLYGLWRERTICCVFSSQKIFSFPIISIVFSVCMKH